MSTLDRASEDVLRGTRRHDPHLAALARGAIRDRARRGDFTPETAMELADMLGIGAEQETAQ